MTARPFFVRTLLSAAILVAVASTAAIAGTPQATGQSTERAAMPVVPVRVDVTLSRYQGEKKISSLPFSLVASAVDPRSTSNYTALYQVRMRMGIDVPITQRVNGQDTTNYRSVGTNIDCLVTRIDETQFSVRLDINDSSIYSPDGDAKGVTAAFRTFNVTNSVILRHGQTVVFGTSTDKNSGEVIKIEVTLTVPK